LVSRASAIKVTEGWTRGGREGQEGGWQEGKRAGKWEG
jgi:hypothetical protein